jgi:2-methylcitrate dehydratase PrpD
MRIIAEPVLQRPATPEWLARWGEVAAATKPSSLPAAVVERVRLVLLDTIGVIAAGAREPEIVRLGERLAPAAKATDAGVPLIGLKRRAHPATAAFLGGTAGTMLELDEGNQFARGHPGIHVVPAAIAVAADRGSTIGELLAAIVLGYEIGARIGIASKLRTTMHPHGTWGTVGAAVAVASLNGAGREEMIAAINIASSLGLSTSRRTMLEGGTVRNTFAGWSNRIGVMVWDLVASGFTGEADGVGAVYGTVIADDWRPEEMTAGLGTRWEISRNYFKRHACCRYIHASLDALESIVAEAGGRIDPDAIERIDIATYVWAAQLAGQEPHNTLAAKFSLPFSIATTLIHGEASVDAFRGPALEDARVRALARRISVREDEAMTAALPHQRPARVTVVLKGGKTFTAQARVNRGDAENPYAHSAILEKFNQLAEPVYGPTGAAAIRDEILTRRLDDGAAPLMQRLEA